MTSATRRRGGFVVLTVALVWITTAIACAAFWPIYRSTEFFLMVGVTVLVATAIGVLGARFRWPGYVVVLATLAAFLLFGVPLAVPSEAQFGVVPTLEGLRDLVLGVALGWKQLLTISLPVGAYQALLVPAFALILVSIVISLSIALRSGRGELAVIPPVVLYLVAVAFGPETPTWPLVLPLALLAAVLFWLVWFRWWRRRESIVLLSSQSADAADAPVETARDRRFIAVRGFLSAALIMAIAGGSAMWAATTVPPSTERSVLRTTVEQPFDPRQYASPLSGFRAFWQPARVDSVLFSVRGLPEGGRIRLATMDTYDGIVYTVGSATVTSESGSFTRVPYRFDQSLLTGNPARIEVTVGSYSGIWVPTIGQFESVRFDGSDAAALRDSFYYNDTSGTAVAVSGLREGDSYSLDAILPAQPTADDLAKLGPGSAQVPPLEELPEGLAAALDEFVSGAQKPGERLVAMLQGLKSTGYISHGVGEDERVSRSGHAADRITQLFTDPIMLGDGEQYAVTAALMARELGFPARVVLGFQPESVGGSAGAEVRGSDVAAWVEVNTAEYGWVAVDATPEVRELPREDQQEPTRVSRPQTIVPPPVAESENVDRQQTPETVKDEPEVENPILAIVFAALRVLGWTALGVAILLAPFLLIVATKLRRRTRRERAPTALERISGGWKEFEDAVVDHGVVTPASGTRSEVAAVVGGNRALVLAAVADRAVFSPTDPDPAEADAVWRAVTELRGTLNAGTTRWQRIKARISLRSLGGYSVTQWLKR